jgi:hypothetical protein
MIVTFYRAMKNNMLLFHYTSTRRFDFGELTFLASSVVCRVRVFCRVRVKQMRV